MQEIHEMPVGLMLALAENMQAFSRFSTMSAEEKNGVIARARGVTSREEMRSLVNGLN